MEILLFDTFYGTTHDGPGMRTTFFLKGCPLRCAWCHNPEGIGREPVLWWDEKKCIGCMECVDLCKSHALTATDAGIRIDREACERCFACADNCPAGALSKVGKSMDVSVLVHEAEKSKTYYETFGGGVTASGGEPMLQHEALSELFRSLHGLGMQTALDTCGDVPWEWYEAVLPETDCVLYDIKLLDAAQHERCTGANNGRILENLTRLVRYRRKKKPSLTMWIRTPLIPGMTDDTENISSIGAFLMETCANDIERWELCSFNNLCIDKYRKLQIPWAFTDTPLIPQTRADAIRSAALFSGFPPDKLVVSGITSAGEPTA